MSITTELELAQRMKAAALKATQGEWCAFSDHASGTYAVHTLEDKRCGDVIKWPGFDGQENAERNAEFIALVNPANVLALVEALEASQSENERMYKTLSERNGEPVEGLVKRIAELEESHAQVIQSRDHYKRMSEEGLKSIREVRGLTVKLPEAFYPYGDIDCPLAVNLDDVKEMLQGIGVAVEGE